MAKRRWSVALPITGVLLVDVDAEDEEAAIEAALNCDYSDKDIETWEAHRQIVGGNVFYGQQNEAEAEDIGEAEEVSP